MMLSVARRTSRPQVSQAISITFRSLSSSSEILPDEHKNEEVKTVGSYTPVTKRLWQQRYKWNAETLAEATPQTNFVAKPPHDIEVCYPFSTDIILREHYRNPWDGVRVGRILEDADSLAGYVAYTHADDKNPKTRPPLLVTATVESIRLKGSHDLSLTTDMKLCGRVVWTGSSSMDIHMELRQKSSIKMSALFTFVARNIITGKPHLINPLRPEKPQDQEVFCERQQVNDARKAARQAAKAGIQAPDSIEKQEYIASLLAAARTKRDLPSLAEPRTLFTEQTKLSNTFTTQPQQRNIHGRIFGGFLMRRSFELAHSTAYLFAGNRPRTELLDQIEFQKPVSVGELLKLDAWVLHTWQHPTDHSKGLAHVQVRADVTQPEHITSWMTNRCNFVFSYDVKKNQHGRYEPPMRILPSTDRHAYEIANVYGPDASGNTLTSTLQSLGLLVK